jgi:GntR family transcriptional repressor for pyruvate dehydrogenase complex
MAASDRQPSAPADLPMPARPRARRTEKIAQSLAREIVQSIVDRGLKPGSVLPSEASMLEEYQVARGSLREALRLLEVQGLILIKPGPGGGPVVGVSDSKHFGRMATMYFQLGGATFANLLEARITLEPMMVRSITERRDPEMTVALRELLERDYDDDDDQGYAELATAFHLIVAASSDNPVLNLISSSIAHIYADRITGATYLPDRRRRVIDDHRNVLRAMVRGQSRHAEQLMREHMTQMGEDVRSRYPGLLDEPVTWY